MVDILAEASEWLADTLKDQASRTVAIVRDMMSTTGVKARLGRPRSGADEVENIRVTEDAVEWLFDPEDYKFGGVATDPRIGDYIDVTVGSESQRYEVNKGIDDRVFVRSETFGNWIRVSAKLVRS
jgi:hypothetical protein